MKGFESRWAVAIAFGVIGLATIVALTEAAPPRPPLPARAVRRPLPPKPAAKKPLPPKLAARRPGAVRPVVPLRRRPLVVRRVGSQVVVVETDDEDNEVTSTPQPVQVDNAENMKPVPTSSFEGATAYRVVSVKGDLSVVLKIEGVDTRVRLVGVDSLAEATGNSGNAAQAQAFLDNLLKNEFVYIKTDSSVADEDAEGTTVANLYRAPDGLFVNVELVRQGYALAARGYSCGHEELLRFYEGKAVADGKGIWGGMATGAQLATQSRDNN